MEIFLSLIRKLKIDSSSSILFHAVLIILNCLKLPHTLEGIAGLILCIRRWADGESDDERIVSVLSLYNLIKNSLSQDKETQTPKKRKISESGKTYFDMEADCYSTSDGSDNSTTEHTSDEGKSNENRGNHIKSFFRFH